MGLLGPSPGPYKLNFNGQNTPCLIPIPGVAAAGYCNAIAEPFTRIEGKA